ncbi:MAG: PEP-CTERM sorting domain-containing protein [Phycisphaeraceae bacterium]|nr:PEP-CTERM sorting domain-containing protein [Phycisphaeraceae bacterium]
MMKSMIAAVAGVAGLAAGANAAYGLKFEVWNGAAWVSSVTATAGDTVKFRFGVYFDPNSAPTITTADGTGTAQALTRFTGSNQAVGFQGTDNFQNIVRTISSGNPALTTVAGATIGTSAVTSFGSQLFLADVPFEPYKEIYVGEVKLDAAGLNHVITLQNKTFGSGSTAGLTFYNSASPVNKQSGAPQAGGPGRVDMNATITVEGIPAPGSLALLGLGGLVAARRRRA